MPFSPSDPSSGESNPFVLFRRAVDAQLRAASVLLRDDAAWTRLDRAFDRAMNPLRVQTERDEPLDDQQRDTWASWGRAFDRTMNPMRISTEEEAGCARDDPDVQAAMRAAGCPAADELLRRHDARVGEDAAWPAGFFESAYSPLRLEGAADMARAGVNWRHAFEDLLMLDAVGYDGGLFQQIDGLRDPALDRMPGARWQQALQERERWFSQMLEWQGAMGLMERSWKRMVETERRGSAAESELAFYEGLGRPEAERKRVDVLSQVTTTEWRVLADGSATTRTVVKRRFADGTEEGEETRESIPGTKEAASMGVRQELKGNKGSWFSFWSS